MSSSNCNFRAIKLCGSFSKGYFPLMFLRAFFNNVSPYYNLVLSAEIINAMADGRSMKILLQLVLITVLGNLMIITLGSYISKLWEDCSQTLLYSESRFYLQKILKMDYSNLESAAVRQLRRRIQESAKIRGHGRQLLLTSIERIINAVVNIILALFISGEILIKSMKGTSAAISMGFCIVIFVLIILNVVYHYKMTAQNVAASRKISNAMADNNRVDNAIDCYNMGKDVRLYHLSPMIMKIKEERLDSHQKAFESYSLFQFKTNMPLLLWNIILNMVTYTFVVYTSIFGFLEIGSIVKHIGVIQKYVQNILGLFRGITDINTNSQYVEDYLSYFDIPQKMDQGKDLVEKCRMPDSSNEYEIEFCKVSFQYPSADSYALKNISLKFKAGKKLAVVGENGSGKTTFVKLLCRLYDPTEGKILLNGIDIKEYDYDEYLSLFSIVFQDFKLFSFPLGQNVAAKDNYDELKVINCLRQAGFGERLAKMPEGVKTCLYKDFDKNGVEISGGEAQKIAIARALYKNAPIIVLDEPTAALDPMAEYEIYSKFNDIVGKKAAIYISHRLSSCRFCDSIVVFDNGQIVQQGPHNALVADEHGKYHELWTAQAQYYTDECRI